VYNTGRSFSWSGGVSTGGWFWRAAYTDYAVHRRDQCGFANPAEYDDVISSPNTGDKGSAYLCGRGAQCKNKGHEFIVNSKSDGNTYLVALSVC
jgi:hypothetical protein